jgi:hypothetical protein
VLVVGGAKILELSSKDTEWAGLTHVFTEVNKFRLDPDQSYNKLVKRIGTKSKVVVAQMQYPLEYLLGGEFEDLKVPPALVKGWYTKLRAHKVTKGKGCSRRRLD